MTSTWQWLERASLPLANLVEPVTVRKALAALGQTVDGQPNAATTMRRRRAVFYNVLQYAMELEALPYNPVDKVKVPARKARIAGTVDRRVVVNARQARELLVAVTYVGRRQLGQRLVALFACMYYAALRPAEALGVREQDCHLPSDGWGYLSLERTRPNAGKRWTDSGDAHDDRWLKHRGEDEPRTVPIPPELVAILRHHIDCFGTAADGRLFDSGRGNVIASSTYSRVWKRARQFALTPRQVASPLAGRPYDLRHACVSLWLNAGVPAPEVAERAGHPVDVLLKVYAKCIDGQAASVNARIQQALRGAP
jgi:integrase